MRPGWCPSCAHAVVGPRLQQGPRLQPYVSQEESELASVLLAEVQSEAERTAAAAPGFPLFAAEESEAAAADAAAPTAAPALAFKLPATIAGELPTPTLTLALALTPTPTLTLITGELRSYSTIIAVIVAVAVAAVSVGAGAAAVLEPTEEAPESKPFWHTLWPK